MAVTPEAIALALEHYRAGRLEDALAIVGRHEIENALGTECAKRGDREGAERHYREAIALLPGFFKPHNNLGNVLRERGERVAAVEHYRAALRAEPSAQRVQSNLGNTLRELGLLVDAADAYRRALELHAGGPVALRLGEVLEALGDTDQAMLAYGRAAEMGEAAATAKQEQLLLAIRRYGPFGRPPVPAPSSDTSERSARGPVVKAAGDELRALLHPVPVATFVREYWGKRPLFVKGFADKYEDLFDGPTFIRAVMAPSLAPASHLRASFDKRVATQPSASGAPESGTAAFNIAPDQAKVLHEAGATLCVSEMETRAPHLSPLLAAIKRQLGYPGVVTFNAYASPPGTGFNWHFDGRIASTLQIEGTKRWRFSRRAAIDWPRGNGVRQTDGSAKYSDPTIARADWERLAPLDERDVTTVILEPGDLLILPAGFWHDACGGPTGSLALNLAFLPFSHGTLVEELLDRRLTSDPAWRATSPLLPAPGAMDPAQIEAVQAQIRRAGDALRALADDPEEIARVWALLVER